MKYQKHGRTAKGTAIVNLLSLDSGEKISAIIPVQNIAEGKYPVFIGSTKDGADFMDRESLDFATSEHFAFNKNQTTLRVIEGYDVVETDKDAYEYLSFEEAGEKVLKVEQTGTAKQETEETA